MEDEQNQNCMNIQEFCLLA